MRFEFICAVSSRQGQNSSYFKLYFINYNPNRGKIQYLIVKSRQDSVDSKKIKVLKCIYSNQNAF